MEIELIKATTKDELLDFIKFPYFLYKKNELWVPPLFNEQINWIVKKKNPFFKENPHVFFLLKRKDRVLARIAVVEDKKINKNKNQKFAYFTLIESIKCYEVFKKVLIAAEEWAKSRKLEGIIGPVSPTRGDHYKGMLIEGFNTRPVIMNSYNPPYYKDFMEKSGYSKLRDLYGYYYRGDKVEIDRKMKVVEYAMKKYGFRIDKFDFSKIEKEARDIEKILNKSQSVWDDVIFPSYQEIIDMILDLKKFADRDILLIARDKKNSPIGFNVILPDYNYVFSKIKGRLGIPEMIEFLYYKRKIKGARMFVMFVIPEYWKKGVSFAIYLTAFRNGIEKGYLYADGSTIDESNIFMRRDAERLGGVHYKTYRIYKKNFV